MAVVDFGLMLRANQSGASIREVLAFNRKCIKALTAGFNTLWLEDHLQWGETDTLECFSTLCYLASEYPRFNVGSLVLGQAYRPPALLAKMAANLQFLSGGRLILGLGAGWKEDEYTAYGYAFPSAKARVEQLEETILVLRALWSGQPANFSGKYYQVHNAYCEPVPSPAIPLLLGGGGEQRTLALVARYADWWNFNSCTLEQYTHKLCVLKQHCQKIGRDIAEIKLSYLGTVSVSEDPSRVVRVPGKHTIAGNSAEVIAELEQFNKLGVTHFMLRFLDVETLEYFVERIVPHFL